MSQAVLAKPPRSAFAELSLSNARELVRDGKTIFFILFFPLFFLAMFGFLGIAIDAQNPTPEVAVVEGQEANNIAQQLNQSGISASVVPSADAAGNATAVVESDGVTANVVLDEQERPAWRGLYNAISATGVPMKAIHGFYSDGSPVYDLLGSSLASIAMVSFLTLALLGTAVPVVSQRGKGILRMLGTTPLRRSTFILAQVPPRVVMATVQLALVLGVTAALGYVEPASIPSLLFTAALGFTMLFALGYLIGSRARNAEATTTVVSLLIPAALILSGSVLPLQMFPEPVANAVSWLPTTVFANALSIDLVGMETPVPLWAHWLYLVGFAAVFAALAVFAFRWDQGEKK